MSLPACKHIAINNEFKSNKHLCGYYIISQYKPYKVNCIYYIILYYIILLLSLIIDNNMYIYIYIYYTHLRGGSTTSILASPARTKMRSPSRSSRTFTCSVDWLVFFLLHYICLYIFWLYDLVYWGPWAEHGDPLFFEHEHSEFYYVCTLES